MPKYKTTIEVAFDTEVTVEAVDTAEAELCVREMGLHDLYLEAWGSVSSIKFLEIEEESNESGDSI